MTDFGHIARSAGDFHIDTWGVGPFLLAIEDRTYSFEDSDRFGPVMLDGNSEPSGFAPAESDPFWRAHRIWVEQGRRTGVDGIACIWDEPAPMIGEQLRGRDIRIVSHGDPDGAVIIVKRGQPS